MQRGNPSAKAKFEYGWCLVRSSSRDDMHKGIKLLEGKCVHAIYSIYCEEE